MLPASLNETFLVHYNQKSWQATVFKGCKLWIKYTYVRSIFILIVIAAFGLQNTKCLLHWPMKALIWFCM